MYMLRIKPLKACSDCRIRGSTICLKSIQQRTELTPDMLPPFLVGIESTLDIRPELSRISASEHHPGKKVSYTRGCHQCRPSPGKIQLGHRVRRGRPSYHHILKGLSVNQQLIHQVTSPPPRLGLSA